jgi:topoisomerase-4 subunit A
VLTGRAESEWLIAKSSGYGFICTLADLFSRQRAGKAFLSMEENARILPPQPLAAETASAHLAALSSDVRLLIFPLAQMKRLSGGKGVQIMGIKGDETLLQTLISPAPVVKIRGIFRNKPKELFSESRHIGQRARRGAGIGLIKEPVLQQADTQGIPKETLL